jgi:PAS domain S-box-containing protein
MERKKTLVDFIFRDDSKINKNRYMQIKEETGKYLITPLKVIALMVALSGIFAMIFEVRHHAEYSTQIYLIRLSATLIAFMILVFLTTKNATKYSTILVHLLLLTIIISSGIMILLLPNSLIVNSQIVGLMIFTSAMFLNWEIKNQILVAIYYNLVFAVAILFNDQKIYFLPNMFESLLFVLFLSMLSVLGSAINFRMRLQIAENAYKTELSEKKFRAIFDNSIDGIYQSTQDGKFLTANSSLTKMLGYDFPEELMTANIYEFYKNPDDRSKLLSEIKKNGSVENYLLHLVNKNKKEITVKLNAKIIRDEENGNRHFFEGTMRDVTSELEALEQREKAELELKAEKDKSDALAKEALKLSSAKSRFLANMSHEIRTPMNGILGFLSLIESDSYSGKEELKNYVQNAKLSAESLLETINAVLDLSKIEAGKLELEKLNFNLKKVIDQAISIVSAKAKEKSLNVTIEAPDSKELNFVGDPTKLRQIYLNLLSNAVKFTKHGEIKINVKLENLGDNKIKVNSSILDTGIGIPADKINELFKPFSQIDGSEGKHFGGTGLGLVICKEFTNLMQGDISVESHQGKGSQFNFTVVIKKQILSAEKLKEQEIALKAESDAISSPETDFKVLYEKRKSYKILLAEDNLINQKVALRMLNSAGYQIDAVMNGEQAVKIYSQKDYDLILMDIQMPEMDGFAATKLIREMGTAKSNVPIIAITAHALVGDREKCLEAGMNEYISKPVVAKEIIQMIDTLLKIDKTMIQQQHSDQKNGNHSFDFERLKQISLGDPVFEKDLLSDFIIDAELKFKSIQENLLNGNSAKIIDIAHTLKGSSYSVGAKLVGDEALGIELSAKNNDLESVEERLLKLNKSITDTREILKNKI